MKFFLVVSTLLFSLTGFTGITKLRVEHIDKGWNSSEPDLLYFSDGRIGVMPTATEREGLSIEGIIEGSMVSVGLDKAHNILSIRKVQAVGTEEKLPDMHGPVPTFEPTILPNMEAVNAVFRKMNRGWQSESQCYNRAHVWNYEEFQRSGTKSKKVFIFYTRKYIRDYDFYWWFHAIPTVLVNHEGTVVERYLDPTFARTPLTMKNWTDIFVRSRRECPVITKYSTYVNNQESEHCYLHFASMYYWQPRDLDNYERTGFQKEDFIRSEVNHAYREAF